MEECGECGGWGGTHSAGCPKAINNALEIAEDLEREDG